MAEDAQGNVLGVRATFVYESDAGVSYNVSLDESVGVACGNTKSTNAALPNLRASARKPLAPRYLLMEQVANPSIKKRVIIGDPANSLFASNGIGPVTINSQAYNITGRVGEKRSTLQVEAT